MNAMQPREIVTTVVLGCFLLALGLIPGIVQGIMEGLANFRDALSHYPRRTYTVETGRRLPGQIWFAVAGAAFIAAGLLAALTR
jgi:hypothetical protein